MLCRQSSSSRSAGSAALSRYETKATGPQGQKPSGTKVARAEAGMLTEVKRELNRDNKTQVSVDALAIKVAKKLATEDSPESVVAAGGYARVLVDCPVTGESHYTN